MSSSAGTTSTGPHRRSSDEVFHAQNVPSRSLGKVVKRKGKGRGEGRDQEKRDEEDRKLERSSLFDDGKRLHRRSLCVAAIQNYTLVPGPPRSSLGSPRRVGRGEGEWVWSSAPRSHAKCCTFQEMNLEESKRRAKA